jgi:hypothetical protein
MPQLLVSHCGSGGPLWRPQGLGSSSKAPTHTRPWHKVGALGRSCGAGRGLVPSTASLCWSRVPAPGLVLSLGAKVDSRQA